MSVKVDQGFLNALVSLFASEALSEEAEYDLFKKDCEYIKTPLVDETSKTETAEQKNFYDELHFSPLKVSSHTVESDPYYFKSLLFFLVRV